MRAEVLIITTIIVLGALDAPRAMADSPLTSTPFCEAYVGVNGFPDIKPGDNLSLYEYLNDQSVPVDFRLAAINRDGWDYHGKHRVEGFKTFLEYEYDIQGLGDILTFCPPEVLICYAYLKAMDDYFNVDESLAIAGIAYLAKPESNTIFMIFTLIWSQKFLDHDEDWSNIYIWPSIARASKDRMEDPMLPEAEQIIFDYIDGYYKYARLEKA